MKNIVRKILICMTSATLGLSLLPSAALASELPSDTTVTEQPSAPTYQASSNATKPSDNKDSKPKISAAEAKYNSAKKAYNSAKSARSKAKAALTKANSSLSKEKKAVKNKKKYAARYFVDSLINDKKYRFDAQYNRARKDKDGNKISKYFGKNSKDKVLLAYNKTNFSNTIRMLKKCNNLRKSEGVKALKVDPELMVLSSISAYISRSYTTGHAFVTDNNASMFVVGENLAWGYSDPFKGWYDEEKKAYKKNKDRYAAGHYFNIKEKSYNVTGFAMANPDNSWLVSEQSFSFDDEGSKNSMSVGDFEKAYNKYLKSGINSQLNKAKKAQASASKAYKKASSKYNSARDALLKLSQPKLSGKAGKKSVTLTWTKVTGATNYNIYRAASQKGKYKKIATVKSTKYVNKKLRSGKKYFYKVRGYRKVSRKNIYSKYSTVKNFKVR